MNRKQKWIAATGATLTLAVAALSVSAHPGTMGGGMGHGPGTGKHGAQTGQQHDGRHAGGPQARAQDAHGLMTEQERSALREKMHAARTPEERQQIAAATRAEMQKRAAEKGITLPEHRGPRARGAGPAATPTPGAQ